MGLKYYYDMKDRPFSDLLWQANIKTKNQLMDFSDSSWQDYPDTGTITGSYIIFYQDGQIHHGTHVPWPVAQSGSEGEYNAACAAGMALAHLKMLIHEFLNKEPTIVPKESPLIILDGKRGVCMANIGKDTQHSSHIARRDHF